MDRKLFTFVFIVLFSLTAPVRTFAADVKDPGAPDSDPQSLRVVEVTEMVYQNGPALAVIVSDRLDPEKRHDEFLETTIKGMPVQGGWVLGDNGQVLYFPNVEPDTEYTVFIRRGLAAKNGLRLKAHVEKTVTTKSINPSFGFADQGLVLPEKLTSGLPVMSVNVDAVDIEFLRVKDENIVKFMKIARIGSSTDRWDLNQIGGYVDSVYMARFNTHGEKNKRSITNIPVEQIEQLQAPGFYIAVMRAPGVFEYRERTSYFFVSDIGLHIRKYENRLEIVSSSLKTGKALPDVSIEVYDDEGKTLGKGYADENGRLSVSGYTEKPFLIVGRLEKHVSFVSLNGAALDLSGFTIDGPVFKPLKIFLYSPRDIYRPGETVDFSALLRDFDGKPVEEVPLHARIKRSDGKEVGRFAWRPRQMGYYHRTFTLPYDSPTGRWSLEVRTDPADKNPSHVHYFRVEEFLPERMKLTLETDQETIRSGENFAVDILGEYLYGAPAAGSRIEASVNIRREIHPVASLKDFHFGNPDDDMKESRRELLDDKLDENGRTILSFIPLPDPPSSPMRATVTCSLYETGGRPVTRSLSRTVRPADKLVGIRPLFAEDRCDANSMAGFETVKIDLEDRLVETTDLQVVLVKEDREYYWEYDDNQGWHWNFSEVNYPVARQGLSTNAESPAKLSVPVEYGRYRLEIMDPETGLTTLYRFHAGWGQELETDSSRPDKVQLVFDKPGYKPGDTAVLTVKPPHAGDAVVMAEADRPLWFTRIAVPAEGADVQIPVSKDWDRHDIYITAMVLRGAEAEKKITPNRAMGVAHFPLDRQDRKLRVSLEAPETMEPEKDLEVTVQIENHDPAGGKTAIVTLAAVDVGVLSITDFKTPDPFEFFFARERFQTDMYDLYGQVIENAEGPRATLKYGGDVDLGGFRGSKRDRAEVKILSLFSGPVETDGQGKAVVRLPVPDFNGRARLMAVAFTDDSFGAGQSEVTIRAPIVAELATARFLAAGDQSFAALDLHNLSGKQRQVSVKVSAESPLRIENGEHRIALEDNEKTTLKMPLSTADNFGVGKIAVSIQSDEIDISRTWELTVRPAYPGIVNSTRQILNPGETATVDPSMGDQLMPDALEVHFAVSPYPPLHLETVLKNLLQYPYGCLEQTVSRAFPYLFLDSDVADRLGVEPVEENVRKKRVEEALARIAGMQKHNGGFALWSGDGPEALWLSPYTVHFLLEAQDLGFAVPDTMLQKALDRLDEKLKTTGRFSVRVRESSPELVFADKAYRAYVLARLNRADLGTLRNLFDNHRKIASTSLPLVHLGIALRLAGDRDRGDRAVIEGLSRKRGGFYYIGDYGSLLRDTAMAIHLLKKHDMDIPDPQTLIFSLDDLLRNRKYFSTQEQNALFLAGLSLTENLKEWSGDIKVGAESDNIVSMNRYVKRLDAAALAAGISFENKSDHALYTSTMVSGYSTSAPAPENEHAVMTRRYYRMDGTPAGEGPFRSGDLLIVHLETVPMENIYDALVIDLLPAGLELENQNLTHSEKLDELKIQGIDLKEEIDNQNVRHMEFRDDRFVAAVELREKQTFHLLYLVRAVTPGTFLLPPPFMEDMYRPEIRAVGKDSGTMTVGQ